MFHVLWYEHLLSLVICHHSSILLFPLILCLFISILSYAYSFHRLSFLYSPSHSTSHFHLFSYQHTLSSLFFYAIPFLSFNPFSPLSHSILPPYSTPFSFILSSFFPFIPFHIILSHSILILSFILFHFNTTILYSYSSLFYIQLLDSILSLHSILLFVPIHHSIPILFLLLLTFLPLSFSIFIHATSILFLLFSLIFSLILSTPIIFFFTIPIHFPIIYLFQSLLLPYH